MKQTLLALLLLSTSTIIANEVQEEIDSIILIDESTQPSNIKQQAIIGCDDDLEIKELQCSKERSGGSNTLDTIAQDSINEDIENIKKQLTDILQQLAKLKTRKEEIRPSSNIKKIHIIQVNSDHVIIKVQRGESLSKYAQKYYGNSHDYQKIYRANPKKIDKNLQIFVGDTLIIPTSDNFQNPEIPDTIKKPKVLEVETKSKTEQTTEHPVETIETNSSTLEMIDQAVFVEDKII
jgi:LysM repeat protein